MTKLATTPCPQCFATYALGIDMRLRAADLGTFSLAGQQIKFAAKFHPVLFCTLCDFEQWGWIDGDQAVFPAMGRNPDGPGPIED